MTKWAKIVLLLGLELIIVSGMLTAACAAWELFMVGALVQSASITCLALGFGVVTTIAIVWFARASWDDL